MSIRSWRDEEMLSVLHMRDIEGLKFQRIADAIGRGKNSVVGVVNRINNETDSTDKAGNQNGTLSPKWWVR
ncbi:MAG: hypothetical protein GXP05_04280 [Alphaproteobacteria bacterium]|nr:hypothetical protein [Alphaproteobacteria bacterium]